MHFEFALELADIDLWNIDLLVTHLDLLGTDIPSKYFVSIHNVFRTSSRHVFKTCLQDMSSRQLQDMSSRRLQDMSSRRLQDVLEEVKLLRSGRVEDVFKKCLEGVLKTSSRPKNVCWDVSTKSEEFSLNLCCFQLFPGFHSGIFNDLVMFTKQLLKISATIFFTWYYTAFSFKSNILVTMKLFCL